MRIKTGIIILLLLVILFVCAVYLFIPSQISVGTFITLPGSSSGISRTLQQKNNWNKFWKGDKQISQSPVFTSSDNYIENEDTFRVAELLHNMLKINISSHGNTMHSTLTVLPIPGDTVALNWSYAEKSFLNPFMRIQQYREAVGVKKSLTGILESMKDYVSVSKNVYGFPIAETSISDTLLISTSLSLQHYPTTADIYSLIDILQSYARDNKTNITGNPFLNITPLEKQQYGIMAALPVDRILLGNNIIQYKRMVPGRFLTTTVTGGNEAITKAYQQMALYFADYQRTAMAIPFQVLITDRKQIDTSGWITKLYFPVM